MDRTLSKTMICWQTIIHSLMALSNSERQSRYRKRRLGIGGKHERIYCLVSITTKRGVERLATHFQCTITEVIERLVNERVSEVLSSLSEEERSIFLTQGFVEEES